MLEILYIFTIILACYVLFEMDVNNEEYKKARQEYYADEKPHYREICQLPV